MLKLKPNIKALKIHRICSSNYFFIVWGIIKVSLSSSFTTIWRDPPVETLPTLPIQFNYHQLNLNLLEIVGNAEYSWQWWHYVLTLASLFNLKFQLVDLNTGQLRDHDLDIAPQINYKQGQRIINTYVN